MISGCISSQCEPSVFKYPREKAQGEKEEMPPYDSYRGKELASAIERFIIAKAEIRLREKNKLTFETILKYI